MPEYDLDSQGSPFATWSFYGVKDVESAYVETQWCDEFDGTLKPTF